MHFRKCIAPIATATANAAANSGSGMNFAQATPINADTRWPPSKGQGWENVLCGAAKSKTADAPIEATTNTTEVEPMKAELIIMTNRMPTNPPAMDIDRSARLTVDV